MPPSSMCVDCTSASYTTHRVRYATPAAQDGVCLQGCDTQIFLRAVPTRCVRAEDTPASLLSAAANQIPLSLAHVKPNFSL